MSLFCLDHSEIAARPRLPSWLRKRLEPDQVALQTSQELEELGLQTICHSGRCPNRNECWSRRTATFMIMGDRCTRDCLFCSVRNAQPFPLDVDEPERIAEAVGRMGLRHVVITSVTRDDLEDGGVGHFAAVVKILKAENPRVIVEVLTPDFMSNQDAAVSVLSRLPIDIFSHNVETVRRLHEKVRAQGDYSMSLSLLKRMASHAGGGRRRWIIKSGAMVGLGETSDEVKETMRDLRTAGCHVLTLGQYLQSYGRGLRVERYISPDEFEHYRKMGYNMGFLVVESGPFVRSSYHAEESFGRIKSYLGYCEDRPRVSKGGVR